MRRQRGSSMKDWIEGLRHWWRWLVGESTLPNKRSGLMLAGTVVVVLLLVFGLLAALRSPARTAQAASTTKNSPSSSFSIPDGNLFGPDGTTGGSTSGSGSGPLSAGSDLAGGSGITGSSSGTTGAVGADGRVK